MWKRSSLRAGNGGERRNCETKRKQRDFAIGHGVARLGERLQWSPVVCNCRIQLDKKALQFPSSVLAHPHHGEGPHLRDERRTFVFGGPTRVECPEGWE